MPPKRKKPGATVPKGYEVVSVVSVSEVEAGVNSHVHKSGSGKSGSNLTEKDKVDFLCLLRQMTVSSEGIGNHTNSGMQSSATPQSSSHELTIHHTDITNWSQPLTGSKPNSSSGNSPEWEYLNFQDLLNNSTKDHSADQRLKGQDIKSLWPESVQNQVGESTTAKVPDQLVPQVFPKSQEMTWPAPPGHQQTKFVRQPMPQPPLPMPNFPQAQHHLPVTQGLMPQAQSPYVTIPLNLQQFTQPQMSHQPESPILSSSPGIRPNSNQNPLSPGVFLAHPGMPQSWQASALLQNQVQHPLGINSKQPFLPVRPVISPQAVIRAQQDLQHFQFQQMQQHMQQPFSSQKQQSSAEQGPNNQCVPNSQNTHPPSRLPPGFVNSSQPPAKPPVDPKFKPEPNESNQFGLSQAQPSVNKSAAQSTKEVNELLGKLALHSGQQPNTTMDQSNKEPQDVKDPRNNRRMIAEPRSPADRQMMDLVKIALNYIEIRGGNRPYCGLCNRWPRDDELLPHLKNFAHKENLEIQNVRVTCSDLPTMRSHVMVLSKFLEEEFEKWRISDAQMVEVNEIVARLNTLLESFISRQPEGEQKRLEGSTIRLYGSLATGLALKDDVKLNLDLYFPNLPKEVAQTLFQDFVKILEGDDSFRDVNLVMADSYSAVNFIDIATTLPVGLSLNNHNPYKLSQLISAYFKLDSRAMKLSLLFRAWAKICQVDNSDESGLLPHAFPILVIHFLQKQRLLPVLHEMVKNRKNDPYAYLDAESASEIWKPKDVCLGQLWVHLLYFYLYEHDVTRFVVCITQSQPFKRADTNWRAKRIAIIDPFQPKRNVACHTSQVMSRYIDDCLLCTFLHFAVPQTEDGPAFGSIRKVPQWLYNNYRPIFMEFQKVCDVVLKLVVTTNAYLDPKSSRSDAAQIRNTLRKALTLIPMFKYLAWMQSRGEIHVLPDIVFGDEGSAPDKKGKLFADWSITNREASEVFSKFRPENLRYEFNKQVFTNGAEAPVWCRACSQVGHKRQDCPDEQMPVPEDMPPLTEQDIGVLNKLCGSVCDKWSASSDEITVRESMKNDLLQYIRNQFPDANLTIFGSSNNGFGSRQSDVDLCLTFGENVDGEGIDFSKMISIIGDILRRHRDASEINPVPMAKVPIVKFVWKKDIQVDLSLYNRLGQENTKLLKAYSEIDPRVRPLVYMMKRFVKTASIGDASRGSLSSYAYTLMVLYYLQQVEPPILPVLQELCESGETPPKVEIENANVYFYSDLANLSKVWPHEENKKTVGELWLDILDFYVSPAFHESKKVVSIRQKDPLYKANKMWMSANLCIEDPFDLSHNLGSGLSRRMNVHIIRSFLYARRQFGSPLPENIPAEEYFFDGEKLTPGKPPCDRGCKVCGHIGHIRDECPERRRVKMAEETKQRRQQNGTERQMTRQQGRGQRTEDNGRSTPRSDEQRKKHGSDPASPSKETGRAADQSADRSADSRDEAQAELDDDGAKSPEKVRKARNWTKRKEGKKSDDKPGKTEGDSPADIVAADEATNTTTIEPSNNNEKARKVGNLPPPPPKAGKDKSSQKSRRPSDWRNNRKKSLPEGSAQNVSGEPNAVANPPQGNDAQVPRKKVPRKRKSQKVEGNGTGSAPAPAN